MNIESNIGHLITIKEMGTNIQVFIFLYITGDDPLDAYERVIKGIRGLRLPAKMRQTTTIQAEPVTDFSRIEYEHPETTGFKIHKLPVTAYFDDIQENFKDLLFLNNLKNITERRGALFPSNRLGAVVTGSDFFDREEVINRVWNQIEKGQNTLICGPRRYGKTSIMREMADGAAERGFTPIMIDLESVYSPQEFLAKIWVEIERPRGTEEDKYKKTAELEDKFVDQWIQEGKKFFRRISKGKGRFLFLLDECPHMLDSFLGKDEADTKKDIAPKNRKITNDFVEWFKEQREKSSNRCSFILAGSINLKPYLDDNGMDRSGFSDCKEVRLPFFDSEIVRTYVESLLLGEGLFLPGDVIGEIVRLTTPGIPYFVQVVITHVKALYRRKPRFSVEDLRRTYHERIIGPDGRRMFDTFERHFKRYGARKPGAKAILKELASVEVDGVEREDLERIYAASSQLSSRKEFDIILKYLEYDFYIEKIKGTNRYHFASPILRDYWRINQ